MKDYLTVRGESVNEFEVSKSRFIARLAPVESLEEGLKYVERIERAHRDAAHNCYAIVGVPGSNEIKCSDDGEPSGTAGVPMLQVLRKNDLQGVVAVVTRYFGGIKLGTGGLNAAYGKSVTDVLAVSDVIKKIYGDVVVLTVTYADYKKLTALLTGDSIEVINVEYRDKVEITLAVALSKSDKLRESFSELTAGKGMLEDVGKKYIIRLTSASKNGLYEK